jgi:hypothetical protein
MNKLIMRLLAAVAITQVGAAGAAMASQNMSAAPDDEAWQQAVSTDSLEAYAKFSMDFPDSRHVRHARAKLAGTTIVPDEAPTPAQPSEPAKSDTMEFVPSSIMVV